MLSGQFIDVQFAHIPRAHRCKSTDGYQTRDPFILRRRVPPHRTPERIPRDENPVRIDYGHMRQRIDRSPDIRHHFTHFGPIRIPVVKMKTLLLTVSKTHHIKREHRKTTLDEPFDILMDAMIESHRSKPLGVI